jgi:ParB-like chromosome segregation protein Spo0J
MTPDRRKPEIREIAVDRIEVGNRLRQPTEEQIAALAASMSEIGQRTPITVRVHDKLERDGRIERGVPVLIAGATRLAAAKKLGQATIAAFVLHDDNAMITLPIAAIPPSGVWVKPEFLEIAVQKRRAGDELEPVRVRQGLGPDGVVYKVVEGHRRLEAARRLGLQEIDAVVVAGLEDALWEVDENLARAELTAAQIAEHTARRKELWERRQETGGSTCATSLADGRGAGPQHQKGFAAETAEKTGRSKATINKALARAEKIAPDVLHAVTGTKLDTGASLDKLARLPAEEQRQVAKDVAEGKLTAISPPRQVVVLGPEPVSRHNQILDILRTHIPRSELNRLLSLAASLPAGTTLQMILRAALRDDGARA